MKRSLVMSGLMAITLAGAGIKANATSLLPLNINEFVAESQVDRYSGYGNFYPDGDITDTDNFVEIYNPNSSTMNIDNYDLKWGDDNSLSGEISGKGFYLLKNPSGSQNLNGKIFLYDSDSKLIDSVFYGKYDPNSLIPEANSHGAYDESISRVSNSDRWIKTYATPGEKNIVAPLPSTALLAGIGFGGYLLSRRKRFKN